MSYIKTNWEDLPSTNTPINATNLNKMDKGIEDLYPTTWVNATLTSNVGGLIRYFKIGNVVVVQFQDLNFSVDVDNGFIFATGLPNATTYIMTALIGFDTPGKPLRVAVNEQGQIVDHWAAIPTGAGNYYGYLIYIMQD